MKRCQTRRRVLIAHRYRVRGWRVADREKGVRIIGQTAVEYIVLALAAAGAAVLILNSIPLLRANWGKQINDFAKQVNGTP